MPAWIQGRSAAQSQNGISDFAGREGGLPPIAAPKENLGGIAPAESPGEIPGAICTSIAHVIKPTGEPKVPFQVITALWVMASRISSWL
jgi:hypothetical protein